jgi:probable DNA metabolism protein
VVYLYDSTFEGALTGVYRMFHNKEKINEAHLLAKAFYQGHLLEKTCEVITDTECAQKVTDWILATFGPQMMKIIAYGFLFEDEEYGTKLFRYLKKAKCIGIKAEESLGDPDIHALYKLYNRVARESHLLVGLLRFMELESGIYYAQFEPTHNIITLLIEHFKARLPDQTWVIHDLKRSIGVFFDQKDVYIKPLETPDFVELSKREHQYQAYWKTYFQHIAIPERDNPRQQRNFMPQKYWRYLVEKPRAKK